MAQVETSEAGARDAGVLGLALLLRVSLVLGVALLFLALLLAAGKPLPRHAPRPRELLAGLAALEPGAVVTAGVLALLLAPALGLGQLATSFLRAGERRYAAAAGAVLAFLVGGVVLAVVAPWR